MVAIVNIKRLSFIGVENTHVTLLTSKVHLKLHIQSYGNLLRSRGVRRDIHITTYYASIPRHAC